MASIPTPTNPRRSFFRSVFIFGSSMVAIGCGAKVSDPSKKLAGTTTKEPDVKGIGSLDSITEATVETSAPVISAFELRSRSEEGEAIIREAASEANLSVATISPKYGFQKSKVKYRLSMIDESGTRYTFSIKLKKKSSLEKFAKKIRTKIAKIQAIATPN